MSSILIGGSRKGLRRKTAAAILAGAGALAWAFFGASEAAAQTSPSDFFHAGQHTFLTNPDIPVRPRVNETIPLLVICMDFPGKQQHKLTIDQIDQAIFGAAPSVTDYYREQSGGRFQFTRAGQGVYGWYSSAYPDAWYSNLDASGVNTSGIRRSDSISTVASDIDFSMFDTNGDGQITPDELAIICIWGDGTINTASSRNTSPAVLSVLTPGPTVQLNLLVAASWEGRANMATFAHELGHSVFGLADIYDTGAALTENVTSFSLMANDWSLNGLMGIPPLDPWARLHLGWLNAQVVTGGGQSGAYFQLRDAETSGDALIFPVYGSGTSEFFVVENRWPGTASTYDSGFAAGAQGLWKGLAIWHIDEELPQQNQVIRLCRATGALPAGLASGSPAPDDGSSLFDGASAARNYDWNDRSAPRSSKTRAGAETGIGIWTMPVSDQVVRIFAGDPYDALAAIDQDIQAQILSLQQQIDEIQTVEIPAARDQWNRGEINREAFLALEKQLNAQIADLGGQLKVIPVERLRRMSSAMESVGPRLPADWSVVRSEN